MKVKRQIYEGKINLSEVSPYDRHEVSIGERFAPQQVGNDGGQDEAGHEEALEVVAVLEHEQGVRLKVRHVDRLPRLHHGRVFPAEKRVHNIMFHHS